MEIILVQSRLKLLALVVLIIPRNGDILFKLLFQSNYFFILGEKNESIRRIATPHEIPVSATLKIGKDQPL